MAQQRRRRIAADGGVANNLAYRKRLAKSASKQLTNPLQWIAFILLVIFVCCGIIH